MKRWQTSTGDCRELLRAGDADRYDSAVTDPPYGYGFMGKDWDHGVPGVAFWSEILRACKPGAHLVAFGGPRTFHRLMCGIEDAGFQIRDTLMWLHGQGYPKSRDISQALDKDAGAERPIISETRTGWKGTLGGTGALGGTKEDVRRVTAPVTEAAIQYDGWGTALKPGWEPIVLARKPFEGTVSQNVLRYGTGGLNIEACKIITEPPTPVSVERWPANVVVSHSLWCVEGEPCADDCPVRMLDAQTGILAPGNHPANRAGLGFGSTSKGTHSETNTQTDTGGGVAFLLLPEAVASGEGNRVAESRTSATQRRPRQRHQQPVPAHHQRAQPSPHGQAGAAYAVALPADDTSARGSAGPVLRQRYHGRGGSA